MKKSIDFRNHKEINVYGTDLTMVCVQNHQISSVILSKSCLNKGDKEFEKSLKTALYTIIRETLDELTLLCEDIITDAYSLGFVEATINERICELQKSFFKK